MRGLPGLGDLPAAADRASLTLEQSVIGQTNVLRTPDHEEGDGAYEVRPRLRFERPAGDLQYQVEYSPTYDYYFRPTESTASTVRPREPLLFAVGDRHRQCAHRPGLLSLDPVGHRDGPEWRRRDHPGRDGTRVSRSPTRPTSTSSRLRRARKARRVRVVRLLDLVQRRQHRRERRARRDEPCNANVLGSAYSDLPAIAASTSWIFIPSRTTHPSHRADRPLRPHADAHLRGTGRPGLDLHRSRCPGPSGRAPLPHGLDRGGDQRRRSSQDCGTFAGQPLLTQCPLAPTTPAGDFFSNQFSTCGPPQCRAVGGRRRPRRIRAPARGAPTGAMGVRKPGTPLRRGGFLGQQWGPRFATLVTGTVQARSGGQTGRCVCAGIGTSARHGERFDRNRGGGGAEPGRGSHLGVFFAQAQGLVVVDRSRRKTTQYWADARLRRQITHSRLGGPGKPAHRDQDRDGLGSQRGPFEDWEGHLHDPLRASLPRLLMAVVSRRRSPRCAARRGVGCARARSRCDRCAWRWRSLVARPGPPSGVHLSWSEDPTSTLTVRWQTPTRPDTGRSGIPMRRRGPRSTRCRCEPAPARVVALAAMKRSCVGWSRERPTVMASSPVRDLASRGGRRERRPNRSELPIRALSRRVRV